LLHKKHLLRLCGILLIAGIVFWSLKRTAFTALVLAMITYYLSEGFYARKKMKVRWLVSSFMVIFIVFSMFSEIEDKTSGTMTARMTSLFEDEGSGRLDIYNAVIRAQRESSILEWILGHGHNAVWREFVYISIRPGGIQALSAHNDWIEILFDYGLPGLFLFGLFHVSLVRNTLKLIRERSRYGPPMAVSYVLFLVMTMTSHLILYPTYLSYLMAFWGLIFALQQQEISKGNIYKTKRTVYATGTA
jgi:O-antigen ligase